MNKLMLATAVSFLLSTPTVLAVDEHHPDQKGVTAGDASIPMGGMQDNMKMMQDNMIKTHELMHKIMQASDPKEREQLMQEHLKMMQDNMKMMHEMMGSGMMGGDMKGGMMGTPSAAPVAPVTPANK